MPNKATRVQRKAEEQQRRQHRAFLDSLPAPDQNGHVIPLVAQLVGDVHQEAQMRWQINSRAVRAVLGPRMLKLYQPHA